MNNAEYSKNKTILCIDYGTKNIGLCLFTGGRDPFPLPYLQIKNAGEEKVTHQLGEIIDDEVVEIIVIGLPKHKDGNDSEMTKLIRKFRETLESTFSGLEFFFQDEALSSFEAEDRMKNSPRYNFKIDKTKVDALAASIILEEWLQQDKL